MSTPSIATSLIAVRIGDFIRTNFLFARTDFLLTDDTRLLESGIIDSMGLLELMAFLEETFEIVIEDGDVKANFSTIATMAAFVARRQG